MKIMVNLPELKKLQTKHKDLEKTVKKYNKSRKQEKKITIEIAKIALAKKSNTKPDTEKLSSIKKSNFLVKNTKHIIIVIGIIYIVSSIIQMNALISDKKLYWEYYSYAPAWFILLRYSFSWFQRFIGISAGIGMLFLKNIYRKILIGLCSFTILTVYWKHPFTAWHNHAIKLDQQFGYLLERAGTNITFESLTIVSLLAYFALEIIFNGSIIYFLIMPSTKKIFHK